MRVTQNSIASSVLTALQSNINRLGATQQHLSSGRQLMKPSDSPAGTVSALEMRSQVAANKQFARNVDDGLGWLGAADGALQSSSDEMARVRQIALQGLTAGAVGDATNREALALEVEQIRDTILGFANTTYLDRPVFGGTASDTFAFKPDGTHNGSTGQVIRQVSAGASVRVDVDGTKIFGSGTGGFYEVLTTVASKLRTNPNGLQAELARIDSVATTIQTGLSTVGSRAAQLEKMRQVADDAVLNLMGSLTEVESIDLPKTITDLQLQQTAYQAALAAGARVVQSSLVDFLR
ncbi:flagellar hook-associated protein 3 [Virgisporangium aliadipatigenens]|uniref:Flagellar hook-associated protein 3 n=1 Tax=Virgisporangium aliadipatigenens TaxID=741659 RepID=A0A8J3YUP5_9ACTN|nr:flagellar hook-associated protein FlgL [Virgisporangium aliadipatigenens]GIJ50842.1 flagellar hook-associated protein 3 [Virgisporangium aliadipatigenens]